MTRFRHLLPLVPRVSRARLPAPSLALLVTLLVALLGAWACAPGEEGNGPRGGAAGARGEEAHEHEPTEAPVKGSIRAEGPSEGREAFPGEAESSDEGSHILHLEPESLQGWGVEVGPVGRTTIMAEMTLPGIVGVNENRTARIAPLVAGQVARIMADLGTRVQAGDTLTALNSPEFTQAQTAFLQAYTQAELTRKDYERAVVLREQRALEEREFLRRQSTFEERLTQLRATEALLRALGMAEERLAELRAGIHIARSGSDSPTVASLLPVRTPISGVVTERDAILGEHVEPGRSLFTVSDLSLLWAHLDAYEHHLPHLETGVDVVVRTPLLPDREFPGTVTVVADQVDPELRTVTVRAQVPNPDGVLRPNMYVQGFLRRRSPGTERLVVPETAVQLLEGEHVVFLELPPEPGEEHRVFQAVHVVPGEILTVGRIIEAGLDGTESVAVEGAFNLKAELTRGAAGHQHVH